MIQHVFLILDLMGLIIIFIGVGYPTKHPRKYLGRSNITIGIGMIMIIIALFDHDAISNFFSTI